MTTRTLGDYEGDADAAVVLAAGIIHPLMFGTEGSYFPELFPTWIRFSGVSIGKQFGVVLGGGIAPLVATSLYSSTSTSYAITGYYMALALGAMITFSFAHETSKSQLPSYHKSNIRAKGCA